MGIFTSRVSGATDLSSSSSTSVNDANEVLRGFDTSKPTAAVIGAGIAGVHVAYELAQLGFCVTVFERRRAVAMGETQYAFPFVGVGLLHPYINTLRMNHELLRGAVAFTFPDIISGGDDSWRSFFSSLVHRWLWSRYWCATSGEQVMRHTDNLSRLSVAVVNDLSLKHPSLAPYILNRDVSVELRGNTSFSNEAIPLKTAHSKPLMFDPVGWTRELARISHDKYGVEFALGEELVDYTTYLRYDLEMVSTMHFSRQVDGHTEYNNRKFDIVVLTAGSQTGQLTWSSSQLPIIGLSGCSVAVQQTAGEAFLALKRALPSSSPSVVSLSPASHLVAYKIPMDSESKDETVMVQGLLSFDSTAKSQLGTSGILSRMEKYLRVKCGLEVPLLQSYQNQLQQKPSDNTLIDDSLKDPIRATRYVRAYTPDGMPLIAGNGAAFNSFVCAGFGDHAADMGPGAAKVLAKLVELEASTMLHHEEKKMKFSASHIKGVVSDERLTQTYQELQVLLNGYRSPSDVPKELELETIKVNPFSSGRFGGVVKTDVSDVSHISPLRRLYNIETSLVHACEPLGHYLNRKAIKLARQDNMPDWLRTVVYYYFNDEEDDEELRLNKKQFAEGLRRVQKEFEVDRGDSSS